MSFGIDRLSHKAFLLGAGAALINIAAFGLMAPIFINHVHHHWIVPAFCGWLLFQGIVAAMLPSDWSRPAYVVILAFASLTGILLFWRQFSMFECFRNCEGQLATGLGALSMLSFIAWRSTSGLGRRFALWAACLFALWAAVIVAK